MELPPHLCPPGPSKGRAQEPAFLPAGLFHAKVATLQFPVSCKGGSRTENPEGEGQLELIAHLLDEEKKEKLVYLGRGVGLLSHCVPGKLHELHAQQPERFHFQG